MKILLATQKPFAAAAVAGIRNIVEEAGYELAILEKYESAEELKAAAADADAMIVRSDKVTKEVIEAAKSLKIVVRAGAGFDNLDLEACSAHGVVAMNTPGQNSNAVAELAIAMMIFMSRNQFTPATVGAKAAALGMNVKAIDPFLTAEQIKAGGAEPAGSLEELYSGCNFVSIHIPATPQTIGSIGYDLVTKMPKGATLVNTARKEVIDEAGLLKALEERTDLKYITDIAPDNLEEMKEKCGLRVFATPKKMGAQTAEANINAGLAAARQIVAFFKEGCTKFQLNK